DVLLLTSSVEGCPNVVLEAQHLGLAVVATRVNGTCDAVLHGRTGFLAPDQDARQLGEYLFRLLGDAKLRRQLAEEGQAFVRRRFGLETMVDLTAQVYQHILGADAATSRIMPQDLGGAAWQSDSSPGHIVRKAS